MKINTVHVLLFSFNYKFRQSYVHFFKVPHTSSLLAREVTSRLKLHRASAASSSVVCVCV